MEPFASDAGATVSVVIPCYNAEDTVGETIQSVLAQTHPLVEIIVVDDASTDASASVVEGFESRVQLLRLAENRGGSHARNRGAAVARGAYLMFLDADDVLEEGTLAALAEAAARDPRAIAFCAWSRLRRDGEEWIAAPPDVPLPDPDADPLAEWLGDRWVPPCAVLWNRAMFERAGGWDEALTTNDDGELMMRAFLRGGRLVRAAGGRAYYRFHADAKVSVGTNLFSRPRLQSAIDVIDRLVAELQSRGDLDRHARRIGFHLQRIAMWGFQHHHDELARECVRRATRLGGRQLVSPRWYGRLLERLLGLEKKERLAHRLADRGLSTRGRWVQRRRRRLWTEGKPDNGDAKTGPPRGATRRGREPSGAPPTKS